MSKPLAVLLLLISSCAFGQVGSSPGVTGGASGGGSGSGTVSNCSAAGIAYYSSSGTTVGCDTSITDTSSVLSALGFNVTGGGTFAINGSISGSSSIGITATGGTLIFPVGSASNPSFQFTGMASNAGIFATTTNVSFTTGGTPDETLGANDFALGRGLGICWSQSTSSTGTCGVTLQLIGTSTTEYLSATTPVISTGVCKITSAVTVNSSATTVCSFTLPNAATTFFLDCKLAYNVTAGTSPTLTLGVNPAQAPGTAGNFSANIYSTNTGTSTQATVAVSASGNTNVLTGASVSTGATYQAYLWGGYISPATSGTLLVTATLGGTGSPAATITTGSSCNMY